MKTAQEFAIYGLAVFFLVIMINIVFWVFIVSSIVSKEKITQELLVSKHEENVLPLIDLLKSKYDGKKLVDLIKDYTKDNDPNNVVEALDYLFSNITRCKFFINDKLIYAKGESIQGRDISLSLGWANVTLVL